MSQHKMADKEYVLDQIQRFKDVLRYADESLKKDRQVVLAAVKKEKHALISAHASLKKDREFILEAVVVNGSVLEFVDASLKKDREIVLAAVKQNGLSLEYADKSFRKDKEIVLEAVKQNGLATVHIDESLLGEREIILAAVKHRGHEYSVKHANDSLKKDRSFILEVIKLNASAFRYIDESFTKDREIVLEFVKKQFNEKQGISFSEKQNFANDILFVYALFKHDVEYARKFSPKISQIIESSNNGLICTKLSGTIIDQYCKSYMDEKDLYYGIELSFLFEPKTKSGLFNFNPSYSAPFVEKLIVFQILKQMNYSELSNGDISLSETVNYYLFCFRLDKFLEDNPSHSTRMKDLKETVENCATRFETLFYTKTEINEIFSFLVKWLESEQTFYNYKQILSKYNELRGDLSKIFKALNHYYKYFKNDYDFLSVLGYGGEGVVFKVFHKKSKVLMAIKFKYETEQSEESANETINLLKRTDMEGKIKFFDCGIIQNHLYSVMELGEESLSNYITRNNENGIYRNALMNRGKLIEILEIFIKVLTSVMSIHDHNILHRDLDPHNIVKIQDQYKIIDFETSRVIKTGNSITIARGKYAYMSPEVSHDNYTDDLLTFNDKLAHNVGNITTSCDIFSLGCIFLKLLTNCPLQLDERFVNDPDVSKYTNNYEYFTQYGKYFYTVVTTVEGEMKLHNAIEKLINRSIDSELGVNIILIRCIITMIQREAIKRLNCYSHKITIENLVKYLKGEITDITLNIQKEINNLKNVKPLRCYFQLVEEVDKLSDENRNLREKIYVLEEKMKNLTLNYQE